MKASIISVVMAIWTSDSLRQPKWAPTITAQLKSHRTNTSAVRNDTETAAEFEVQSDGKNLYTSSSQPS